MGDSQLSYPTEAITLYNCASDDLSRAFSRWGIKARLIHFDPPWLYSDGGRDRMRGVASGHYKGLPTVQIARSLALTCGVAAPDSYLAVWCTMPKLQEWMVESYVLVKSAGWEYLSGGCWGKTDNRGIGVHFRGDAEVLLLYRMGRPKPASGYRSNLWLSRRAGHSEKPQSALRALVELAVPPDGLVLDYYAGASASMALACRSLGRSYAGAEIDPGRYELAMTRLSQQEMQLA